MCAPFCWFEYPTTSWLTGTQNWCDELNKLELHSREHPMRRNGIENKIIKVHCKSFSLTIWRETTLEDFKTTFKWPEYKDSSALWFGGGGYKTLSQRFQPSVSTLRKWKCRETGLEARGGRPIATRKGWSKTTHRPPPKTFKVILL